MPDAVEVKIEGLPDLLKQLSKLGINVKKTERAAVRAGSRVVANEAESWAGSLDKHGGKHIRISVDAKTGQNIVGHVGFTKKKWFFRFFETGASSHEIVGKKNALVFEGVVGLVVIGRVHHPGIPAQPILRRAIEMRQAAAVAAVGATLRVAIIERRYELDHGDDPE